MRDNNGFGDTIAVRHEIEEIVIYEVTDTELNVLQRYSVIDIYFDIAIAATTLCLSSGASLLAIDFANQAKWVDVLFLSLCIASLFAAASAWLLWGFTKNSKKDLITKIKNRKAKQSDNTAE